MFIGEYQHSIDTKGRLIMPSKFRESLGEVFYVTRGVEKCLYAYSQEEWDKISEKLDQLPITTNRDAGAFVRFFLSGACECEVDKQGRILVSGKLKQYAQLSKEVTIIGVSKRVEIWDSAVWNEYSNTDALSPEQITANMEHIGLQF